MSALDDLITAVERAEGPSREIDGRVAWAFGWRFNGFSSFTDGRDIEEATDRPDFGDWPMMAGHWRQPDGDFCRGDFDGAKWPDPPQWTASIDAVVALIRREMPEWDEEYARYDRRAVARLWRPTVGTIRAEAATPALALLLAFLRAARARQENDNA